MDFLETNDPEKKRLIEASDRHKRELEKEVTAITEKTERVFTNALIIGGTLALSYFIVSQFSKRRKKRKKKKELPDPSTEATAETDESNNESGSEGSLLSEIGTKVINQATLILIDIARQKLMEYLQSAKKDDAA